MYSYIRLTEGTKREKSLSSCVLIAHLRLALRPVRGSMPSKSQISFPSVGLVQIQHPTRASYNKSKKNEHSVVQNRRNEAPPLDHNVRVLVRLSAGNVTLKAF